MSENTDKKTKPSISIVSSDRDKTTIDIPLSESRREAERIQRVRRAKRRRRRASLSNYIAMLNVTAMMGLICFGFVYVTFFKHETIAEDENRYLAKFPKFSVSSYLNGEYTEGVANYFDDTVHNRAKIKTFIADKIMPLKGMKYGGDDGVELFGGTFEHVSSKTTAPVTTAVTTVSSASSDGTAATSAQETVVTTTTAEPLPNAAEPAAENGEVTNNILIVNGRGISLYGGGWGNELEYASYLNQYKEALGDSVNVYSMVLPTSSAFYLPENYQSLSYNEKDDFDRIAAALVNVTPIRLCSNTRMSLSTRAQTTTGSLSALTMPHRNLQKMPEFRSPNSTIQTTKQLRSPDMWALSTATRRAQRSSTIPRTSYSTNPRPTLP